MTNPQADDPAGRLAELSREVDGLHAAGGALRHQLALLLAESRRLRAHRRDLQDMLAAASAVLREPRRRARARGQGLTDAGRPRRGAGDAERG
jgi:hypothetical protein